MGNYSFKDEPARFDLDTELGRAEDSAAARVLRETAGGIQPGTAFAERLEARLRVGSRTTSQVSNGGLWSRFVAGGRKADGASRRPVGRMWLVGIGLAVAVVAVFWLTVLSLSTPKEHILTGTVVQPITFPTTLPAGLGSGGDFVPTGKVRHMVIAHSSYDAGATKPTNPDWTEDVWIGNGKSNYIMRRTLATYGSPAGLAVDLVVSDTTTWEYFPVKYWHFGDADKVYKMPYNAHFLDGYLPDKDYFDRTSAQATGRWVGDETLDGVSVTRIGSTGNAQPQPWVDAASAAQSSSMDVLVFRRNAISLFDQWTMVWDRASGTGYAAPVAPVTPIVNISPGGPAQDTIDYTLWVSRDYRVVQQQYDVKSSPRNNDRGRIYTYVAKLVVDELLDQSSVRPDLFAFTPPDPSTVIEAIPVFTELEPQATSSGQAQASNWQVYNAPGGDFSLLMPSGSPDISLASSWRMTQLEQNGVTYGVAYRDYDTVPTDGTAIADWLKQRLPDVEASMDGKVTMQTPITLNTYTGLDLGIARTDGTFARSHIFLVGKRLYNVYAIAKNEQIAYSQELNLSLFLGSFKVLKP